MKPHTTQGYEPWFNFNGSLLTVFDFFLAFGYLGAKQKTTAHNLDVVANAKRP